MHTLRQLIYVVQAAFFMAKGAAPVHPALGEVIRCSELISTVGFPNVTSYDGFHKCLVA